MENTIKKLHEFSKKITTFYSSCPTNKILEFGILFQIKLPEDYKVFLANTNGFSLMSTIIYGIENEKEDLSAVYQREHEEVNNPMPGHLIPFSPDGQGGFYCFDGNTINNESSRIVFWDSGYDYSDELPEVVNDSFLEWVNEVLIDWTIEDNEVSDLYD